MGCQSASTTPNQRRIGNHGLPTTTIAQEMGRSRTPQGTNTTQEVINTNFKAQYYKEKQERPAAYLLEPVNISAQRKVASIRTGSHNLRCETGKWTPDDPLATICPFCEEGAVETVEHALLECMAFSHIRTNFPDVKDSNTLASLLSKKPNLEEVVEKGA